MFNYLSLRLKYNHFNVMSRKKKPKKINPNYKISRGGIRL